MKFKWFRNFLKGCSLTTALFVFQACYGTGPVHPEEWIETLYSFEILTEDGSKAVNNAKIYAKYYPGQISWVDSTITSADGKALMHFRYPERVDPVFRIEADGYIAKDTVLSYLSEERTVIVFLQKAE